MYSEEQHKLSETATVCVLSPPLHSQYTGSRTSEGHMVLRDTRSHPNQCPSTKNTIVLFRQVQNLWKVWYCTTAYYGLWQPPADMGVVGQEDRNDSRTEERYIPTIRLLRPDCEIWPPTRRRAVMWILAHTVHYQLSRPKESNQTDYNTYIRRSKQSLYIQSQRRRLVAN
jgi:hypothetical protein